MSKTSNKNITMIFIISAIIVVVGITGWVGKSVWDKVEAQKQEKILQDTIKKQEIARKKQQAEAFENILNTLLDNVREQATEYKKERKVLSELIKTTNLTSPDYIAENLALMERIIPSLRSKMDEIMLAFERADISFKEVAAQRSQESQEKLNAEWQAMTSEHFETYVTFFDFEEKQMKLHLELMKLYNQHATTIQYDADKEELIFESPSIEEESARLRNEIKQLYLEQSKSLTAKSAKQKFESDAR